MHDQQAVARVGVLLEQEVDSGGVVGVDVVLDRDPGLGRLVQILRRHQPGELPVPPRIAGERDAAAGGGHEAQERIDLRRAGVEVQDRLYEASGPAGGEAVDARRGRRDAAGLDDAGGAAGGEPGENRHDCRVEGPAGREGVDHEQDRSRRRRRVRGGAGRGGDDVGGLEVGAVAEPPGQEEESEKSRYGGGDAERQVARGAGCGGRRSPRCGGGRRAAARFNRVRRAIASRHRLRALAGAPSRARRSRAPECPSPCA